MTSSSDLCSYGCNPCACPDDVSIDHAIAYCKTELSDSSVNTLVDIRYKVKLENPYNRGTRECPYQLRVRMYKEGDSNQELIQPTAGTHDQISGCAYQTKDEEGNLGEEYSDIVFVNFPGEVEELSEVEIFRNYAFENAKLKKILFEIEVWTKSSSDSDPYDCESWSLLEKIDCEESNTTAISENSEDCKCKFSTSISKDDYEINTCNLPSCHPCGQDCTIESQGLLDENDNSEQEEEKSNSQDESSNNEESILEVIKTSAVPTTYPFYAKYRVKYTNIGSSEPIVKVVTISCATEYKPGTSEVNTFDHIATEARFFSAITNLADQKLRDTELEVEILKNDDEPVPLLSSERASDCRCDCLYGNLNEDKKSQSEYTVNNDLNSEQVDLEINYLNVNCAIGNCNALNNDSDSSGPKYKEKGWFRYTFELSNLLSFKLGHNCEYDIQVKLKYTGGLDNEELFMDIHTIDLVKQIKDIAVEQREQIKSFTLERTVEIDELSNTIFYGNSNEFSIEICALNGKPSAKDGYSDEYNNEQEWDCNCCQTYDYTYFEDYRTTVKLPKCVPCLKSDVISDESFTFNTSDSNFYYNAEMDGSFLMYANIDVDGEDKKLLIGNGKDESYSHKMHIEKLDSDSEVSGGGEKTIKHESI